MYKQREINIRGSWLDMFADLRVGDKTTADVKDRSKIAISISNGFHKPKLAKFKTYINKENKSELIIERIS